MATIENFAALSTQDQKAFAAALLKIINIDSIFSSDTNFELVSVEADDITGDLIINVSQTDVIEVSREATWTCNSDNEVTDDPGYDADYKNDIYEDIQKAFKTLSTVIDDYKVSLEVADIISDDDTLDVIVDSTNAEDGGIGDYEYFGFRGHDSQPYVEVKGTIIKACDCALAFFVEPNDEPTVDPEAEEI